MTAKKAWDHFLKSQRPDFTYLGKNFVEILKPEFVFKL